MINKKNAEELEKLVKDQLFYGVSVAEIVEDGTINRIDPFSEEGQKAIEKNKGIKNETNTN
jgi:hypothetical protein